MKTGLKVTAEVFIGPQGGKYYITNHGTKHYGHPPTGTVITAEHHVGAEGPPERVAAKMPKLVSTGKGKPIGGMTLAEAHETFARLDKKGVGNLSNKDFDKYAEAHDIIKGKKTALDGHTHITSPDKLSNPNKVNPTSLTGTKFEEKKPPVVKPEKKPPVAKEPKIPPVTSPVIKVPPVTKEPPAVKPPPVVVPPVVKPPVEVQPSRSKAELTAYHRDEEIQKIKTAEFFLEAGELEKSMVIHWHKTLNDSSEKLINHYKAVNDLNGLKRVEEDKVRILASARPRVAEIDREEEGKRIRSKYDGRLYDKKDYLSDANQKDKPSLIVAYDHLETHLKKGYELGEAGDSKGKFFSEVVLPPHLHEAANHAAKFVDLGPAIRHGILGEVKGNPAQGAAGTYAYWSKEVCVKDYTGHKRDESLSSARVGKDTFSVTPPHASGVSDGVGVMSSTLVHEISHGMHMNLAPAERVAALSPPQGKDTLAAMLNRQPTANEKRKEAGRKLFDEMNEHSKNLDLNKVPSRYGLSDNHEWAAEAHTAYVFHKAEYKKLDPEGYELIKRMRLHYGMEE